MLGVVVHQARKDPAASGLIGKAIEQRPNFPQAYSNLGNLLGDRGDYGGAITACRKAIALSPYFAEAYNNLGTALKGQGHLEAAASSYARALEIDPAYRPAACNLSIALHDLRRYEQALAVHDRVIALDPTCSAGYVNRGVTLHALDQFEAADTACRQALALNPRDSRAHHNRGLSLQELDRLEEALLSFRCALDVDAGYADGHWNYALALLSAGRLREGWAEYEWRWRVQGFPSRLRHGQYPRWDGRPLGDRTVLLYAEQGLGDTIQFARYAPMVDRQAGHVIIECAPSLERLLCSLPGVEAVVQDTEVPPRFDVQLPLLSVPFLFGTTLETIPAEVSYLHPVMDDVQRWRHRLQGVGGRRIGLAWAGSATHARDRRRSISLDRLAPLFALPDAHWFSLQTGERAADVRNLAPGMLTDLSADLSDFAETAAVIADLDLVVTVDTSVAHLAGALGRPVWVLLPFVADWRWLRQREDSPWYPTMRLFRQPKPGDWDSVIERVRADLARDLAAA